MRCRYCKRPIGLLRRLWDRDFCSADHRKRAASRSARAVRDREDLDEFEEPWLILPRNNKQKPQSNFGPLVALTLAVAAVLTMMLLPASQMPAPLARYTLRSGTWINSQLGWALPGKPSIQLREDFRAGLNDWVSGVTGQFNDWGMDAGVVRPGRLRLWKPSLDLTDYQFAFQGQIERKAMGWAFRAKDVRNYYATKITVSAPHGGVRADIERYVVLNGREGERVRLPIPLHIQTDTIYSVRVKVKGDRYSTYVNGQVVDVWRDSRLRSGGVGFFADKGETAALRWVSLSDRESFWSRLLSLGFLIGPADMKFGTEP